MVIPVTVWYKLESVATLNHYQKVRMSILNLMILDIYSINYDINKKINMRMLRLDRH